MINEHLNAFDILLLEDDPADAFLVKIALKEGKVLANLHHAIDGKDGLDFVHQVGKYADAPRPDIILLDLNMPRMNGYEFLTKIKSDPWLSDIPVIVLTTSDVENDVVCSHQLGAASYISKPVDMPQFVSAINKLGDYWFTLVRLPQRHKA
jgi:CheY-like chemotaxis protein